MMTDIVQWLKRIAKESQAVFENTVGEQKYLYDVFLVVYLWQCVCF